MATQLHLSKVIGHRGACGYAPENTLISMRKAYELGVQWVEFDVMLTRDGEAIIMHDYTLDRTTSGHGKIAEIPYTTITQVDAGSWFAQQFVGEHVPTFVQLLQYLAKLHLNIVVEIKPTPGKEIETARKTMQLLEQYWTHSIPLVSSASIESLKTVQQMDSKVPLGFIADRWPKDWQHILDDLGCISFHVNHRLLDPEKIAAIKKVGCKVLSYTINDVELAEKLFNWGVAAVFSDYPDRIQTGGGHALRNYL